METIGIEEWIYATLANDSTLISALGGTAIYSYLAPQTAGMPYVVYGLQSAEDDFAMDGSRAAVYTIYRVLAVNQSETMNSLKGIAQRIDTLLNAKKGTATINGDVIINAERIEPLAFVEVQDGVRVNYLGGLYRIWV